MIRCCILSRLSHVLHEVSNSLTKPSLTQKRMALSRIPLRRLGALGQRELGCLRGPLRPQLVHINRTQSCTRLTHSAAAQSKVAESVGSDQKTVGQQLREEWARYSMRLVVSQNGMAQSVLTRSR
jgi:hypothetical protein